MEGASEEGCEDPQTRRTAKTRCQTNSKFEQRKDELVVDSSHRLVAKEEKGERSCDERTKRAKRGPVPDYRQHHERYLHEWHECDSKTVTVRIQEPSTYGQEHPLHSIFVIFQRQQQFDDGSWHPGDIDEAAVGLHTIFTYQGHAEASPESKHNQPNFESQKTKYSKWNLEVTLVVSHIIRPPKFNKKSVTLILNN
jgi:hypothetical protein